MPDLKVHYNVKTFLFQTGGCTGEFTLLARFYSAHCISFCPCCLRIALPICQGLMKCNCSFSYSTRLLNRHICNVYQFFTSLPANLSTRCLLKATMEAVSNRKVVTSVYTLATLYWQCSLPYSLLLSYSTLLSNNRAILNSKAIHNNKGTLSKDTHNSKAMVVLLPCSSNVSIAGSLSIIS